MSKVEGMRRRVPEICFGTDVIVGFPTETEDDFLETISLLEAVKFDTVYSFVYSSRPGTVASGFEDPVSAGDKMERLQRLQAVQKGIQERRNRAWIGRTAEILVEGRSKRDADKWTGRTPEARIVNFPGPSAPGRLETVRIVGATAFSLRGELVGRRS